jgi:putative MATE family efflux protein
VFRTKPPPRVARLLRESTDRELPEHFNRELKQSIFREVLAMGLPSMAGFMLMIVYEIVDMFWLAMIGPAPVAAVTIFGSILWVLASPNMIVGAGSVAVISRRYGEGDEVRTERSIKNTFVLKFGIGLAFGLPAILFLRPVLTMMGAEPNVIDLGWRYGVVQLCTLGFAMTSYSIYTAFRGIGQPNTALFVSVAGTGLNIVLDPLLIFGVGPLPKLGILGASLATSLAHITVVITGFSLLARQRSPIRVSWLRPPWPRINDMWQILRVGAPSGINDFSFALAQTVVVRFVATYGTIIVALFGMSSKILQFGIMIVAGLGLGTGALIGQFLGSRERHKAWLAGILSIRLSVALTSIFAVLVVVFAPQVVRVFFDDPLMLGPGEAILRIMAISMPMIALHIAAEEVFMGAGQNTPPMVLSIIHSWVMVVPFMYFAGNVFHWGPNGLMWGWSVAHVIGALAIYWLFRRGTWLKHEI